MTSIALRNDENSLISSKVLDRDAYVSKALILQVERFSSPAEHFAQGKMFKPSYSETPDEEMRFYYSELFRRVASRSECTCGCADMLDDEHLMQTNCMCNLRVFPLYEVTVKNYTERSNPINGYTTHFTKTVTYLLHPDEREAMALHLAGQDDPGHELVQLFKYAPPSALLPNGGAEYQAHEASFDSNKRARI